MLTFRLSLNCRRRTATRMFVEAAEQLRCVVRVESEFRSIGTQKTGVLLRRDLLASAAGQKCTNDTLDILRGTMPRLPPQFAPLVYGIIQSAITTAVASAIAVGQLTGIGVRFLVEWLSAWSLAFLIMLPVVVFVAPLI